MFSKASRICWVGTWRRFSHFFFPWKWPNWISSVSIAPNRVSNLKLEISSRSTPISFLHSSNRPTQSLKVPIFATLPGISESLSRGGPRRTYGPRPHRIEAPRAQRSLFGLEFCRPLLDVSLQTFLGVFTLKQQLLILAFQGQGRLKRNLPTRLYGTFDASHGSSRFVRRTKLARVLKDVLPKVLTLVNVVDDPQLQRLFKGVGIAGDHQLDGLAFAHQAREPLGSAGAWENAQIDFR